MRIAALYDAHGNLPALGAVLGEVEALDVDLVLVGGDVASDGCPRVARVGGEPCSRRTPYDVEAAAARIAAHEYPKRDEYVEYLLGSEPSRPERMTRLIEGNA